MAEIDKSVAAAVGHRLRGGHLVEQAGEIRTLALGELDRFKQEQLLGNADVTKLDDAVAVVIKGLHDRTVASSEAHLQTAGQVTALHDLKADRKRLTECVVRAFRHSPELVHFRQGTYQGATIANFCTDMNRKLAFAKEHQSELSVVGAGPTFVTQVETKLRTLESDSGAQEAAIASLPDNTRAFCEAKGRLYFIIKDLISAARALHAKEPEAAAKYNLKVLYRRGSGKGKGEVVPVVPAPEPAPAK
jgi:hypothetical protein